MNLMFPVVGRLLHLFHPRTRCTINAVCRLNACAFVVVPLNNFFFKTTKSAPSKRMRLTHSEFLAILAVTIRPITRPCAFPRTIPTDL